MFCNYKYVLSSTEVSKIYLVIMPKGRTGYVLGNSLIVHNLPCGRTFTGDERSTEARIAAHKKCCLQCFNADIKVDRVMRSEPGMSASDIISKATKDQRELAGRLVA